MSRNIIYEVKKSCRKPLAEDGQAMIPSVSASSVQRTIASVGLHQRKAQKVVYLTKTQKRAQKQWALQYKGWKERDWGTVIWSDECYVYLGDDRGTVWVTRTAEEEFDENCIIPTFKQSTI